MTQPLPNNQTSALRIIEPTEVIDVRFPIFLLFGQPGVGKSSLGFSADNPVLLNFDTESAIARTVNRGRAINVLTIEELEELEKNSDLLDPFSTVVVDPVGGCVNLMSAAIIERNARYGRDGSLTQQGWGVLKTRFRSWMTRLRAKQKNILLVAHHKEDKNGDSVFVRPDIAGGSKDEVMRLADFVGFLYMNGKERVLDFNPTEAWFGKNPAQWKPFKVPAPEKARTFMAQLFQDGRTQLSKASEASASVANQVNDWRAEIDTFTKASEFNAVIPKIKTLPEPLQSQVAKTLIDFGGKRGLLWNTKEKQFSEPTPVQEKVASLL